MPLPLLKQQIEAAITSASTADPASARTATANALANAIDAYIQEQIGQRLALISGAIMTPCPTPVGPVPTPPVPGPGFGAFTRMS